MDPQQRAFIRKTWALKRAGYALIAVGLIFLTFMTMSPELSVASVIVYSYFLLGLGFVLVLVNKGLEIIQYLRLRKTKAYCLSCGWYGTGADWYRCECCPECDSERVTIG